MKGIDTKIFYLILSHFKTGSSTFSLTHVFKHFEQEEFDESLNSILTRFFIIIYMLFDEILNFKTISFLSYIYPHHQELKKFLWWSNTFALTFWNKNRNDQCNYSKLLKTGSLTAQLRVKEGIKRNRGWKKMMRALNVSLVKWIDDHCNAWMKCKERHSFT